MANTYRFGDASRPGLLIGLSGRQAIPIVAGVLWMALAMQTAAPVPIVLGGPIVGVIIAFGRFRGAPLAEVFAPACRLWIARRTGRACWVHSSLIAAGPGHVDLPEPLGGLELIEAPAPWLARPIGVAVVRDRRAGTVTGVLRATSTGFPLSSPDEQDGLLASWGAALAPLARERTPVTKIAWQEWAHTLGAHEHQAFLTETGIDPDHSELAADYLELVERQGGASVRHDVTLTLTVDQRRIRRRRTTSPLDAAIATLLEELRLLADRLGSAGITVEDPLTPAQLTSDLRLRSDPIRARPVQHLSRTLAAASGRGAVEWGPMAVEASWGHVQVDATVHRGYRVASWPMLPVGGDWLGPLLGVAGATRTVTVVMEPTPISRAARSADREVMNREADADMKARRGFRVSAQDRKRLADVMTRERELTEGHPEFRFVGLVDIAATDTDTLDEAAALVEQAAAQSLIDLRPLEARHDLSWVASLPLGRNVTAGAWK
jgi:hypothetical protein